MIKIKYQNDEAGEDDTDVEDVEDDEVEEARETLDQSSCELCPLRCPQKGIWNFFVSAYCLSHKNINIPLIWLIFETPENPVRESYLK